MRIDRKHWYAQGDLEKDGPLWPVILDPMKGRRVDMEDVADVGRSDVYSGMMNSHFVPTRLGASTRQPYLTSSVTLKEAVRRVKLE